MTATLPGIYLSWDESAEPLPTFIGYRVYKRELGVTAWTNIELISDRSRPYTTVYGVKSGQVYEIGVSVVAEVSGDEVESTISTVQSSVVFTDSFLHATDSPGSYTDLNVTGQSYPVEQDVQFVQPAGRSAPIAHVGRRRVKNLRLTIGAEYHASGPWAALELLVDRQYSNGSVLCYRDGLGLLVYCQLVGPQRTDQPMVYGAQLELRQVNYSEAL